jgi:hypothetical protein
MKPRIITAYDDVKQEVCTSCNQVFETSASDVDFCEDCDSLLEACDVEVDDMSEDMPLYDSTDEEDKESVEYEE